MKLRDKEHRASPLSQVYEHDGFTLTMLPGADFGTATVYGRIKDSEVPSAAAAFLALMAFALWDDPRWEWELDADPDGVFDLDPDEQASLAVRCVAELYTPRTVRLGIDYGIVAVLADRAACTHLPSTLARIEAMRPPGEAAPPQNGPSESSPAPTA